MSTEHTESDGGPAFAAAMPASPEQHDLHFQVGMSLRDYFAAACLTGMTQGIESCNEEYLARECYKMADGMLKEREKV